MLEGMKEELQREKELIHSYLERDSMFDGKSPLRGFFTLFWIVMAYYLLQTLIVYWKESGSMIGLVTLSLLSEDMINLMISDAIMLAVSTLCFPLQRMIARNIFNKKQILVLQTMLELGFICTCAVWCFTRKWYFIQKGIFILHSLVMLMKVHSYCEINKTCHFKYLGYINIKSKAKDAKLDLKTKDLLLKDLCFNDSKSMYPDNLTVSNFIDFYLIPSLVYQLEYPRIKKIRYWYVLEKLIASIGIIGLMYISVEHYLAPIFQSTQKESLFELWIRLTIPFTIIHLLIFYLVFECICNGFAEITRYADRNFYDDWWNSSNFLEYSNKWNKPVHRFLKTHVYTSFINLGCSKKKSLFLTFLISAIFHEIAMVSAFSHPTIFFFMLQMAQLPLIYLMRIKLISDRPWLGNALFWLGLSIGVPLISLYYGRVDRPLLPISFSSFY